MREHLFRGKSKNKGKWAYGNYFAEEKCDYITRNFISPLGDFGTRPDLGYVLVDKNTIGEYTGFCDKNGKKIFEGDIIKYFEMYNGEAFDDVYTVEWIDSEGLFSLRSVRCEEHSDLFCANIVKFYEVVGNVHDDPELVKTEASKCI